MKRMALSLLLASSLAALSLPASAQETQPGQSVCWLGSLSYSQGAEIRGASGVTTCTEKGTWQSVSKPAAGCIYENKFFNTGAVVNAGGNATTRQRLQTCQADGIWK
jgi:hypothetical protein